MAAKKQSRADALEEYYMNRRSWLIDTAETATDRKNLTKDLGELDRDYQRVRASLPKTENKKPKGKK